MAKHEIHYEITEISGPGATKLSRIFHVNNAILLHGGSLWRDGGDCQTATA